MPRSPAQALAYEAQLAALASLLRTQPATASEIARAFRCPRVTVYAWLAALSDCGVEVVVEEKRSVGMGPKTAAYAVRS